MYGGGVLIYRTGDQTGAGGIITNCLITSCRAYAAGAVYMYRTSRAEVKNSVLEWNTATNTPWGGGGAINSLYQWNYIPLVKDCILRYNDCPNNGSAISAYNSFVMINCEVVSNSLNAGNAALYFVDTGGFFQDGPIISNCYIAHNSRDGAYGPGGLGAETKLKLYNTTIVSNHAYTISAGLLTGSKSTSEVYNCTIAYNRTFNGHAGYVGGGIECRTNTAFVNCVIYSNFYNTANHEQSNYRPGLPWISFTNCCTFPMPDYGENNITEPPKFLAPPWNFRLGPDSPCLNAGTNQSWMYGALDLDGRRRIDYFIGVVDIGAFEHTTPGTMIKFR